MRKSLRIILFVLAGLIFLAAGFGTYYFYTKYQKLKKNPNTVVQEETKVLVKKVGKLMELPTGEDPTLATVQDKDKLKDQAFFSSSENGDRVLIYIKAKKAILYRPSSDKIVEVAPLVMSENSATATPEETATPKKK